MHFSLNVLFVRNAFAAYLWGTLLLPLFFASYSVAFDPLESMAISSRVLAHATSSSVVHYDPKEAALSEPSDLNHQHAIRISASDLQSRLDLERRIQLAAFQQFDSHKTGRLYNVSVPELQLGNVLAIRLRSGSFRRYGVNISEFIIPQHCIVDPIPERILLVYARLVNRSLFQDAGFVLASNVLSVLVYDAGNLNSSQPPQQISVTTTASRISIEFPQSSNTKCAQFADNSTTFNIADSIQGVCQVEHLGTFALVSTAVTPGPAPSPREEQPSASSTQNKHSNTWKIVVGSVIGGLALLAFVSLLALGIGKRRKDAKLSRMEYQAEQGETLQMATVRNSRVPAAANTRTQAALVNEYSV